MQYTHILASKAEATINLALQYKRAWEIAKPIPASSGAWGPGRACPGARVRRAAARRSARVWDPAVLVMGWCLNYANPSWRDDMSCTGTGSSDGPAWVTDMLTWA